MPLPPRHKIGNINILLKARSLQQKDMSALEQHVCFPDNLGPLGTNQCCTLRMTTFETARHVFSFCRGRGSGAPKKTAARVRRQRPRRVDDAQQRQNPQ